MERKILRSKEKKGVEELLMSPLLKRHILENLP